MDEEIRKWANEIEQYALVLGLDEGICGIHVARVQGQWYAGIGQTQVFADTPTGAMLKLRSDLRAKIQKQYDDLAKALQR